MPWTFSEEKQPVIMQTRHLVWEVDVMVLGTSGSWQIRGLYWMPEVHPDFLCSLIFFFYEIGR